MENGHTDAYGLAGGNGDVDHRCQPQLAPQVGGWRAEQQGMSFSRAAAAGQPYLEKASDKENDEVASNSVSLLRRPPFSGAPSIPIHALVAMNLPRSACTRNAGRIYCESGCIDR